MIDSVHIMMISPGTRFAGCIISFSGIGQINIQEGADMAGDYFVVDNLSGLLNTMSFEIMKNSNIANLHII